MRILEIQLKHSNTPTHNYETMQKYHINYVPNACSQGTYCLKMVQLAHFSWYGHQEQTKAFHTIGDSLSTPSFFLFSLGIGTGALEVFEHIESVNILVILNPTGYMWTSSGLAFIHLRSSL